MGPGMIYSRLCPWKTQRSRGSGKIPLFLHSLGFFRTIPGCFHPPHVPPALPSLLDARWRIRKGTKTFPAHSGRSIPPILPHAPASIPLLRPSRWIFPAGMGKGRTKTSFNWIFGVFFLFPMDPFPVSFCFQAGKFFEEASAQSSSYPKSRGSLDLLPHWCDPSMTRLPQTTEFPDPIPSS